MVSILEIIKGRKKGLEVQEEDKIEKVLKEISTINEKVESLTQILNSYIEDADFKF